MDGVSDKGLFRDNGRAGSLKNSFAARANAACDMTGNGLPLEQIRDEAPILAGRRDDDGAQVLPRNNNFRKQGSSPLA